MDIAGAKGLGHGVTVHPRQHQHLARVVLLGDGGNQPLGIKVDLVQHLFEGVGCIV